MDPDSKIWAVPDFWTVGDFLMPNSHPLEGVLVFVSLRNQAQRNVGM